MASEHLVLWGIDSLYELRTNSIKNTRQQTLFLRMTSCYSCPATPPATPVLLLLLLLLSGYTPATLLLLLLPFLSCYAPATLLPLMSCIHFLQVIPRRSRAVADCVRWLDCRRSHGSTTAARPNGTPLLVMQEISLMTSEIADRTSEIGDRTSEIGHRR